MTYLVLSNREGPVCHPWIFLKCRLCPVLRADCVLRGLCTERPSTARYGDVSAPRSTPRPAPVRAGPSADTGVVSSTGSAPHGASLRRRLGGPVGVPGSSCGLPPLPSLLLGLLPQPAHHTLLFLGSRRYSAPPHRTQLRGHPASRPSPSKEPLGICITLCPHQLHNGSVRRGFPEASSHPSRLQRGLYSIRETHAQAHADAHAHACTHPRTRIHTNTHTHSCAHPHTRGGALSAPRALRPSCPRLPRPREVSPTSVP